MGSNQSRYDDDDQRREDLMRRNNEYVRDIADHYDKFGDFPHLINNSDGQNHFNNNNNNNKQIQINGVIYELDNFLNEGGFGKVFKGKQKNSNRLVAIKVMPHTSEIKEEIENEIKFLNLTKSIPMNNHPIIEYFGCQTNPDKIYIAMELAESDLLTFWFNQIKQTNSEKRFAFGLTVIIYVLRALIFLEKLNIIHGDIKPQNLVIIKGINQTFSIKLIDFGTVEKMFTKRNQLTVDVTKAHTIFFASPEFLKRDSNNLMKRHLHKKSDAWAAGVMFYILFFEKLPWKDQYDYENFCNDSNARDIRVPKQGGFQLIIELLLKKNPNERASAKDTFMQIKSHPTMGKIIENIQRKFYPADDVLNIIVPDQVRQQLSKFGKHPSSSTTHNGERRPCRYGKDCYRKDQEHRQEFIHPGDRDFDPSLSIQSQKKPCRYGTQCFRMDLEHRQKYLHPNQNNITSNKENCRYGNGCTNNDFEHRQRFRHPTNSHSIKERCRYHPNCTKRTDREHMQRFSHN